MQRGPIGNIWRWRRSPVVLVAAAAIVLWWSLFLLIAGIDPFNIYPWGAQVHLDARDYDMLGTPYVFAAAMNDPHIDAYLIGGSTSLGFKRASLDKFLPGIHDAMNLSYAAPRPGDLTAINRMLLSQAHPRRVIFEVDWIYQLNHESPFWYDRNNTSFPSYLYDDDRLNDVRMVGILGARLALNVAAGRPLWTPAWDARNSDRRFQIVYDRFQTRQNMIGLTALVARHRTDVDRPTSLTCASLDLLNEELLPLARELSRRHVAVDIVFPPNALVMYYYWLESGREIAVHRSFLSDQLLLRHCMANALDGVPGVSIFAFDNEDWITGDLANYRDDSHLQDKKIYDYMLQAIAAGRDRLTKQNVDAETRELRDRIKAYQVRDTKLGFGPAGAPR